MPEVFNKEPNENTFGVCSDYIKNYEIIVPENKIPLFKVFMADTAAEEVTKVLDSGYIGQGPKVDEFEA